MQMFPLLLDTIPSSLIPSCLFYLAFAFGDSIGCCGIVGLQNPAKTGESLCYCTGRFYGEPVPEVGLGRG